MKPKENRRPRLSTEDGDEVIAATKTIITPKKYLITGLTTEQSRAFDDWLTGSCAIPAQVPAYITVVEIAAGRYRRRPYLTLAAAEAAVQRAERRGVSARVILCRLEPLGSPS